MVLGSVCRDLYLWALWLCVCFRKRQAASASAGPLLMLLHFVAHKGKYDLLSNKFVDKRQAVMLALPMWEDWFLVCFTLWFKVGFTMYSVWVGDVIAQKFKRCWSCVYKKSGPLLVSQLISFMFLFQVVMASKRQGGQSTSSQQDSDDIQVHVCECMCVHAARSLYVRHVMTDKCHCRCGWKKTVCMWACVTCAVWSNVLYNKPSLCCHATFVGKHLSSVNWI